LVFGGTGVSGGVDLNGRSQQVAGLSVASGTANYITNSSATPVTFTVNTPAATPSTNAAVIAGNLSLVKAGPDTLTLAAANVYSGNTTVAAGTLALAQATLATNSTITVSNGAVLQLDFAVTNRVGALVLNGVSQASGFYSAGNASPYLSGGGTLQVVNLNPVLPTTPTNLTFSVTSSNVTLGWPAAYTGWILQAQTNALNVGLTGTNWYYVSGSELTNVVTLPINQVDPAVFFRMARTNQP
jgi:autotransporter-associated beta strand protein